MANILIIGAGGVGSVVVHKCAQVAKEGGTFDKITLASRTVAHCDAIAASVKSRYGVDIAEYTIDCEPGIARPAKYW